MATATVAARSASAEVAALLESPEIGALIRHLEETRWTGRPGYPIRTMVGMALAKSMYAISTWAKLVRLVEEHAALQDALGCVGDVPSQWACYRFAKKLRENGDALDACVSRVIAELHRRLPDYGKDIAIDASDLPAYANGQRYLYNHGPERERFSDPDASWGHRSAVSTRRGGGFYGYKLQAAVCTKTGLPVAWEVETARANESTFVASLLDTAKARGFTVETCAMDKAYDSNRVYDECIERGCQPIVPLKRTPPIVRGEHLPPSCEHGPWRFAGSDYRRGAAKWRCPSGECAPASTWIRADRLHPLIPRETLRWKGLYRRRAAVEREFGRLKHEWALLPLRVRGIDRVRLHADLTILAKLAATLERARTTLREREPHRSRALAKVVSAREGRAQKPDRVGKNTLRTGSDDEGSRDDLRGVYAHQASRSSERRNSCRRVPVRVQRGGARERAEAPPGGRGHHQRKPERQADEGRTRARRIHRGPDSRYDGNDEGLQLQRPTVRPLYAAQPMMSLRNLPTAASSRLQDRDEEWARLLIAILAEATRALDVPVGTALYVFGSACDGHRAPSDIDILIVYPGGHLTQAHLLAESIRNATSPYLFDVLVLSTSEERELAFIETERASLIWPHDA